MSLKPFLKLSIVILTLNTSVVFGQDQFANALKNLKYKLDFTSTSKLYDSYDRPNKKLVQKFSDCSDFQNLEGLQKLDFNKVVKVKYSELSTSKWDGNWKMEFQEWTFNSENSAESFFQILEPIEHNRIQFCVNKGGIMWWRNKNKLYVITSRAYFLTFHYNEIKQAIVKGLNNKN